MHFFGDAKWFDSPRQRSVYRRQQSQISTQSLFTIRLGSSGPDVTTFTAQQPRRQPRRLTEKVSRKITIRIENTDFI
jgi:hypothetical protein